VLAAEHASLAIDGVPLVRDASIRVQSGRVTAIMGPNGAGKSTLLRLLAGDAAPDSGDITFDGQPLENVSIIERARRRAVVPQRSSIAFGFTVLETVLIGRYPHGGDQARTTDIRIARQALARAGVAPFESRLMPTLSGGELARVMLARALAQIDGNVGPRYLLLDEPTGSLDPAHQHHVLRLLRDMAGNNMYYLTNSITVGGGESADVIIDVSDTTQYPVVAGTKKIFYLYSTNLDHLANDAENFGGQMSEIVVQD